MILNEKVKKALSMTGNAMYTGMAALSGQAPHQSLLEAMKPVNAGDAYPVEMKMDPKVKY